ncbi:MAG: DUF1073 domain-containing protein [Acidaminococcales bacterium]|jgi:phage-related protein (TIGR01555 family)|nr:DUF1073 domain-containing protein [Acidaminococcales bacterium]
MSPAYGSPCTSAEFYKKPATLGRPDKKIALAQDEALAPALEMLRRDFPLGAPGAFPCFLGYGRLLALAQDGLIRAGVEMLAEDCVSKWIELSAQGETDEDGNGLPDMEEDLRRYHVKDLLRRAVASCGYFGGCLVFVDTGNEQKDLINPLVLDEKTFPRNSLKNLALVDPYNISPGEYNSANPCASDYYSPSSWYVQGVPIHESRFLYFAMNELPSLLKPAYNFFGMPLAQTVLDAAEHFAECREAEARLLTKFSLTVLKTNLDEILSGGAGEMLNRRIRHMVQNRTNDGVETIDNESEDVVNIATPLSGVTDIVRQSMEMVAAYFKEPVTKMWGISPAGFNATGENDMRNHHEHILATQEKLLRRPLEKILKILCLNRSGKLDDALTFHFVPLNEEAKSSIAATQKAKAETDNMYIEMGVLSPEEVRQSLIDDPESGYGGIDPYDMPGVPEEAPPEEGEALPGGEGQSAAGQGFAPAKEQGGNPDAEGVALDAAGDDTKWITVNGAHVPIKNGEPQGKTGEKIKAQSQAAPLPGAGKNAIIKALKTLKEVRGENGEAFKIAPGATVRGIKTLFGKGAKKPIRDEPRLLKTYGGKSGDWEKGRATTYVVDENGQKKKAEIHYYREPSIGCVEFKFKKWIAK